MNSIKKGSRILGIAFLLQFVTSFASGVFVQPALIVSGDIGETMQRIAGNPALMRGYILLDMLTALGVIFLGVMLYETLKEENEKVALVALSFYILEGALLAASRLDAFSLLRISQAYAAAGEPLYLQSMAEVALEAMDFVGFQLHMLAFCAGAILFYFLLYRSRAVPAVLSLWGLVTVVPLLAATLLGIFEIEVPFIVAVPYVPFELVIGVWILVKGTRAVERTAAALRTEPGLAGS